MNMKFQCVQWKLKRQEESNILPFEEWWNCAGEWLWSNWEFIGIWKPNQTAGTIFVFVDLLFDGDCGVLV